MTSPRSRFACGFALMAALAVLAPRTAFAQKKVSLDSRLPSDVYVYVSMPDVKAMKSRFKASSFGRMIDDKAFDAFRKDVEVLIKKGSAEIEKQVGLKLDDILAIPSGELSLAVTKSERKVPTFVFSLDFGKSEATLDKILKLIRDEVKKQGIKRTTVTHKGTEIVIYKQTAEAAGPAGQLEFSYLIKDSTLVFATESAALQGVLDRWDGKTEGSFAKNEVYSYIRKRTRPGDRPPVLTWYVDPLGLLNAALNAVPNIPDQARQGVTMLSFLGIANLKAMGGSMDLSVGEYDSLSKTLIYVKQPTTGVLNIFSFPAVSQRPPKWVAPKVESYMAVNWDLTKAYSAVANLYGAVSLGGPDALDKLIDQLEKAEGGPGIHIKKDVLNQLTGRMYLVTEPGEGAGPLAMTFIGALGVKDEAKMQAVLTKLAKLPTFPGKEKKVAGKTIYEIDLGAVGAGGAVLGIGVDSGHLFITSDVAALEQIVKGKGDEKTLADSKDYKALIAKMPGKTSMISFQSGGASQLKDVWSMLRSGIVGGADIPVDFTKLPKFSAVKKYLHASGSYAVPDKNGVYMESLQLKAKE